MTGKMTRTCTIDGCDKPHLSRGWCRMHYNRWRRHGDPLVGGRPERPETCMYDGCVERHSAQGYCEKHYERWRKHGDPGVILPPRNSRSNGSMTCRVETCDIAHRIIHGYCRNHLRRLQIYGDPLGQPPQRQPDACTFPGCDDPCEGLSLCKFHYQRHYHGIPLDQPLRTDHPDTCSMPDCDGEYHASDLCVRHYSLTVTHRRNALKRSTAPVWPVRPELVSERLSMMNGRCYLCGDALPADWQVEHVKPLASGGLHALANLRPACSECNYTKNAAWPVDTSTAAVRLDPTRLP